MDNRTEYTEKLWNDLLLELIDKYFKNSSTVINKFSTL